MFETGTDFPDSGDYSSLTVTVFNNYSFTSWSGTTSLGSGFQFFAYGPRYSGSPNAYNWQAHKTVNYTISANPDFAEFELYCPFCSSGCHFSPG